MEWKIFLPEGEFVAQTSVATYAAWLIGALPEGSYIKWEHRKIVYRSGPGHDGDLAGDSADATADLILRRRDRYQLAQVERHRRR